MMRWYDAARNEKTQVSRFALAELLCELGLFSDKDAAMLLLKNRLDPEIYLSENVGFVAYL